MRMIEYSGTSDFIVIISAEMQIKRWMERHGVETGLGGDTRANSRRVLHERRRATSDQVRCVDGMRMGHAG